MQIKLDTKGEVPILTVSGLVASDSLDVLKAGVSKLLAAGKNRLVVDLTQAEISPGLESRLRELESMVVGASGKILTRGRQAELEAEKTRLLANLTQTEALGLEIKRLRRENGELQTLASNLEADVELRLKRRKAPFSTAAIESSLSDVHEVMANVFSRIGLFKAGAQ